MSKKELYTTISAEVETLLSTTKVSKEFKEHLYAILETHLKPKKAGSVAENPSYLDEATGLMMHFCRFHARYEGEDDMVMSNGKSKGYCKASIAKWTKLGKEIQKLESSVTVALRADNIEQAKEFSLKVEELKAARNKVESFNYEEDWTEFRKGK